MWNDPAGGWLGGGAEKRGALPSRIDRARSSALQTIGEISRHIRLGWRDDVTQPGLALVRDYLQLPDAANSTGLRQLELGRALERRTVVALIEIHASPTSGQARSRPGKHRGRSRRPRSAHLLRPFRRAPPEHAREWHSQAPGATPLPSRRFRTPSSASQPTPRLRRRQPGAARTPMPSLLHSRSVRPPRFARIKRYRVSESLSAPTHSCSR
jgi:hypothetical protein